MTSAPGELAWAVTQEISDSVTASRDCLDPMQRVAEIIQRALDAERIDALEWVSERCAFHSGKHADAEELRCAIDQECHDQEQQIRARGRA